MAFDPLTRIEGVAGPPADNHFPRRPRRDPPRVAGFGVRAAEDAPGDVGA